MHLRMLIAHPYAAAVTAVTIFLIITIIIVVIKHLKHVPTQKSYLYYRCIYITDGASQMYFIF